VLVNITKPDSSTQTQTLTLNSSPIYEFNFTNTSLLGNYTVRIIANDTSGNINNTETIQFTIQDNLPPSITTLGCLPDPVNVSQTTTCNATITDNLAISNVTANVTLPNGTIQEQPIRQLLLQLHCEFTWHT